jgi:hypothetical protein
LCYADLKKGGVAREILWIFLGVILDRMWNLVARKLKEWSEKSLLKNLSIAKHGQPFVYEDVAYWSILLTVGKGNYFARLLCQKGTNLKLTANVRFKSEGDNFKADAYEVNAGWHRRKVSFPLQPASLIKIAVARRIMSKTGYYLYPIGGTFANYPLTGTYDLIVELKEEGEEKAVELQDNTIKEYIKEGNPA